MGTNNSAFVLRTGDARRNIVFFQSAWMVAGFVPGRIHARADPAIRLTTEHGTS